jgi:phage gpG-like protein
MTITIDVDERALNLLFDKVRGVVEERSLLDSIGHALREEASLSFTDSRDPYGKPWKPLKRRKGQPLLDTGLLRNSLAYRVNGLVLELGTNVDYAGPHQYGTKHIPARPFFPRLEDGLPPAWAAAVGETVQAYFAERFEK